jgi:Flp pilus assembly protein TadD
MPARMVARAETARTTSKKSGLLAIALMLAVLAAFSPILTNQFINFDDGVYVTSNTHVQNGLTLVNLGWAFTTTEASNWHPLTWVSHMIDCQLYGLRPWGHHLTSLLLHAANTLLLFFLLKQVTGADWRSFFVAALFGLHPLRVESVAWAAERKDVLSTFFFLLTLHAYWHYARLAAPKSKLKYYWLALLLFALGLMSKPMLVTLPLVLLLLDFWPMGRFKISGWKTLLLEKIPFAALAAASCAQTMTVQARSTTMLEHLTAMNRLENGLVSYVRYLAKTFWPTRLAVFYPHPGSWSLAQTFGSCLILSAISIWAFRWRKRIPSPAMGWLWFVVTLLPVIGLIQVGRQSIADRYTYIPSIGLFLALVWLADSVLSSWPHRRRLFAILGPALLILCGGWTYRQAGYWKNGEIVFRHAIAVTDGNYLAHSNLGDALHAQGRTADAIREYQKALDLRPTEVNSRNSLGSFFLSLNRIDEAIEQFRLALRYAPDFAEAHNNLGYAFQKKGDQALAMTEFQTALRLNRGDYRVHLNLASASMALGKTDEALEELKSASSLEPGDILTRVALGNLLFNTGRIDEALTQFVATLKIAPTNAEAHANLGMALARKGRNEEATVHLREALRLQPNYPEAEAQLRTLTLPH